MSNWIDADQQMPAQKDNESSETVLCYLGDEMIVSGFRDYNDGEWYDFDGELIDEVTHWMPIPTPPSE